MRSLRPNARYLEPLLKLKNDDPHMKAAHKVCRETPSDTFLPVIERAHSVPIKDRPIDMNHFKSDSLGYKILDPTSSTMSKCKMKYILGSLQ